MVGEEIKRENSLVGGDKIGASSLVVRTTRGSKLVGGRLKTNGQSHWSSQKEASILLIGAKDKKTRQWFSLEDLGRGWTVEQSRPGINSNFNLLSFPVVCGGHLETNPRGLGEYTHGNGHKIGQVNLNINFDLQFY